MLHLPAPLGSALRPCCGVASRPRVRPEFSLRETQADNRLRFWFRGAANRCGDLRNCIFASRRLADPRSPWRSRLGGADRVAQPVGEASVVKNSGILDLKKLPNGI